MGIDKRALREKYAAERDKRLRPDGNAQYLRLEGQLSHYLDDPYTPRVERQPVRDHVTVAIVGGGFAGLLTGARLKEAGIDDLRIVRRQTGSDIDVYAAPDVLERLTQRFAYLFVGHGDPDAAYRPILRPRPTGS